MICESGGVTYRYGDEIKLKVMADVHLGHTYCDVTAFKQYLEDSDRNTYFIGNGDLLDAIITKDMRRYRKSLDATQGDDVIDQQILMIYDLLAPYKRKILGLGSGNHEDYITKFCGTDPMKRLCEMLDVPFLGYSWLFKLYMREPDGARVRSVIIRGHHGWGGGSRTEGADLTKYWREAAGWDADIFIYGHVHQKKQDRRPRGGLAGDRTLIARPQILVINGTFLKTFSDGVDPTYAESRGYPMTEIGGVTIHIKPNRRWVDLGVTI
jgi:predicted phosphodiesterase